MPKKSKSVGLDSTPCYGVGVLEDAKARSKHQALMQDYEELRREVDAMRMKLEAGKRRKIILAAETRFLRRRCEYFMKTKTIDSSQKGKLVLKHSTPIKKLTRKEANEYVLPPLLKKKKQLCGKEATQQNSLASAFNHSRIERLHKNDAASSNIFLGFDLNQDSAKETSVPTRTPIFDLNEISMGDEDVHSNAEASHFEEGKRSLSAQNDLMLSICRNGGEGPSRAGKRKISWQDPVALRV